MDNPSYCAIEEPHQLIHDLAHQVLHDIKHGNSEQANQKIATIHKLKQVVLTCLMDLQALALSDKH
jgi:hypothetical protein